MKAPSSSGRPIDINASSSLIRTFNYHLPLNTLGHVYNINMPSSSVERIRFLIRVYIVELSSSSTDRGPASGPTPMVLQNAGDDIRQFCCGHRIHIAMSIVALLIGAVLFTLPLSAIFGFLNLAGIAAIGPVAGMLSINCVVGCSYLVRHPHRLAAVYHR
jgi:hypothetical protein